MRNSERFKYSKGGAGKPSSGSKPQGKSKVWIEIKWDSTFDMKGQNKNIHKPISKGIVGKVNLKKVAAVY